MNTEKKSGGKAPIKSVVAVNSQSKSQKKRPFAKDGTFSISKIKHNIKRCIRTNDRFAGNVPQLSDNTLNVLATIAIDMAKKLSDTAGDCAKKVGKQTIGNEEILAAVGIELKGELMTHCLGYMKEALAKSTVKKSK
ncbi:hypothetical protein COBT_002478 [Conglomerata obtusa]